MIADIYDSKGGKNIDSSQPALVSTAESRHDQP